MLMTQSPSAGDNSPRSFLLQQLECFNWGPFAHLHRAEIDPEGTAIIGQTGSGKTTLVDAIMTLIAQRPLYNLASTGGHESDRDIISYVRGVSGAGNESGGDEHVARPGSTVTALSACFSNGEESVRLAVLFWIEGTSSAMADLKRAWMFARQDDPGIADLLEMHRHGGIRAVKQWGREQEGVTFFDSKKAYLAQVRRFFEVGENAFELLNRAAGLKQLNSVDDLFRQLVLDDRSMFNRALEVANEFEDLKAIHTELEIAREQRDSLLPIAEEYERYQRHRQQLHEYQALNQVLPVWFAQHAYALWQQRYEQTQQQIDEYDRIASQLEQQIQQQQQQVDQLHGQYMQAGGSSIQQLQSQVQAQQELLVQRRRNARDYESLVKRLQLDERIEQRYFAANQQTAKQQREQCLQQSDQADQDAFDQGARCHDVKQRLQEVEQELEQVKAAPDSNIPGRFQAFKQALAEALDMESDELAFVAELVEVKSEEQRWRGAIERALGAHRLRLLVPQARIKEALRWVNQHHLGLHVRLMDAVVPNKAANFFDDGFVRKLNFKPHPHREALKHFLAGIDRHCVERPEQLQTTPHAMTEQGLMSGRRGFYDKQDQKRLDQDWMTGFDNQDRLLALQQQLQSTRDDYRIKEQAYQQAIQSSKQLRQTLDLIENLLQLEFHEIDLRPVQQEIDRLHQALQELQDPDSDIARLQQDWRQAQQQLDQLREQDKDNSKQLAVWQDRQQQAETLKQRAFKRIGKGLDDEQKTLADNHLKPPTYEQLDQIEELERQAQERVQRSVSEFQKALAQSEIELGKLMVRAKNKDTGALTEAGTEIEDVAEFIERLRVLNEEALPEKLDRFLRYLNQSSDQGVTQLLAGIDNEVNVIEERIEDLNRTMRQVDFQPGRYLRLEPRRVKHESLTRLQQARKDLRAAALKVDDSGEAHYRALMEMVALLREAADKRKTLAAKALLDPRYRLQFYVSVIDRDNGQVIETRTGSQGGSGGEKEIIASYILTASLSYALCPAGSAIPLFGTIVLDEAFSKSSMAVAARIISALRQFGLHPLFITPNKEMRLLREHTRSAILVHRVGQQAKTTSLSWQQLDRQAEKKLQQVKQKLRHTLGQATDEIPR